MKRSFIIAAVVAAGAGPSFGSVGFHAGGALGWRFTRHLSLAADVGYSHLPLSGSAVGSPIEVSWGLLTLAAKARPSGPISPYAFAGYGFGRYVPPVGEAETGKAGALGAGVDVSIRPRWRLFIEGRLAVLGGITAADGAHLELPVRIGVRFAL